MVVDRWEYSCSRSGRGLLSADFYQSARDLYPRPRATARDCCLSSADLRAVLRREASRGPTMERRNPDTRRASMRLLYPTPSPSPQRSYNQTEMRDEASGMRTHLAHTSSKWGRSRLPPLRRWSCGHRVRCIAELGKLAYSTAMQFQHRCRPSLYLYLPLVCVCVCLCVCLSLPT